MAALRIPTVTESDLLDFHTVLYGRPFPGASSSSHYVAHKHLSDEADRQYRAKQDLSEPTKDQHVWDDDDDDDDGLGYYPDGVKRSLTDEQISMFRHSEIQQLLRDRRLARENAEGLEPIHGSPALSHEGSDGFEKGEMEEGEYEPAEAIIIPDATGSGEEQKALIEDSSKEDGKVGDEEEKEYARFLEAERLEFQRAAAAKRNGERLTYDSSDRTISTRRRVREMDQLHADAPEVTLMYDDEASAAPSTPIVSQERVDVAPISQPIDAQDMGVPTNKDLKKMPGRKFWWPEIRPQG